MSASGALISTICRFLRVHAPFSRMGSEDIEFAARQLELAYFADGEVLIEPSSGAPDACWIVKQGAIEGLRPVSGGDANSLEVVLRLGPGDVFPMGALLANRPVTSTYRASGDAFCWRLAAPAFDELTRRSPPFLDFCRGRMAALLDLSRESAQSATSIQGTQWRSMSRPIADVARGPVLTCDESESLRSAFSTMEAKGVGSLIITRQVEATAKPVGIFTRQDVIGRVVLPGIDLQTPIGAVMTSPLKTIEAVETVAQAMLQMAEWGVRHLPITDGERLVGVVTERDLFVLQRRGLRQIGDSIRLAMAPEALRQVAGDIREWSLSLVAQGISPGFITGLISRLTDQLTSRLVSLLAGQRGIDESRYCWLALGSEGREERTIAGDQDNGLIVADGDELPLAQWCALGDAINRELDACGYPLCTGGVMAGNPAWCLPLSRWKSQFEEWIERGDPTSLLHASIFFDFRGVCGTRPMAQELREHVADRARANPRFLKQMSDNALRNGPPKGWGAGLLGQLFNTEEPQLELKLQGTGPLVEAARVLSLAHGVRGTGTAVRLQALADAGVLRAEEVRNWIDAFQYLQGLRLRVQQGEGVSLATANQLDTADLSELDHRILREVFRQARQLQQRLALDYPG